MDPSARLIKMFGDLMLNVVSHEQEDLGHYTERYFSEVHEEIASKIGCAIRTRNLVKLPSLMLRSDVELGFERVAQDVDHEVALIALGSTADDYDHVAAAQGTRSQVRLPIEQALPHLIHRASRGIKTHVLMIHNHPSHPFKELLEERLGVPLGPSSQDRLVSSKWSQLPAQLEKFVAVEMLLFESGNWRKISLPSAEQLFQLFVRLMDSLESR